MCTRSRLGLDITPDLMNNFFQIKSKSSQQGAKERYVKHHVGSSAMTRGTSGGATPGYAFNLNDINNFEEQLRLGINEDDDDEISTLNSKEPVNEFLIPEPIDDDYTPASIPKEISIEVYDNFSFEHLYDNTLPITDERDHIIQTVEANRVTIIQGSTGSGKTTQVPQYILDHYQKRRKYCNILVTQPRRIAAISVAKRVSQERNWPLGTLVGYQVARDRQVTEDTRITYLTTGVLLQKLIKNKNLNDYTHIILDEVHERDQEIDFSMLVVKKYLRTVSKHVKVVLMSATVDSEIFSNYFAMIINDKKEGAPVISVEGRMYDVAEYYFEDISGLSVLPQQSIYDPEITAECYHLCRELIIALDKDEMQENYEVGKYGENRGTVLCFLPGLPEITTMHTYLADIEGKRKYKIIPLHSQITSSEQAKVFIPSKKGERKIILSTNIAESSITVPDIKYVIDFCLTKNTEIDADSNYQRLVLQWASKASLSQRRGRAGRVSDGHCFRLISNSLYNDFDEYSLPEIMRASLAQVILQAKLLELGPPALTLQLAIQAPLVSDIKRNILLLKEVGALTLYQSGRINPLDGDITFVGRVIGSLPVDVHIAKLLLIGYVFGVLEECLVIGACLSLKSLFSRPFRDDLKAYVKKMEWANQMSCDLLASLNAFMSWKYRKLHFGFGKSEKAWAQQNFLEWRRFKEVDQLVEDLRSRLQNFNIHTYRDIFKRNSIEKDDELVLKLVIAGAFYPNYFVSREIDEKEATKTMSGQNPFTTVMLQGAPKTLCHYRVSVAQLFRGCGRGKRFHFESSRFFVEFEKETSGDMTVVPAVYSAIKMRQLRIPLSILVSKKKDEAFRKMEINPLESFHPETGLRTNRVNTGLDKEGRISVTTFEDSKQVKLKDSQYINLFIMHVITPGHFWATYSDDENSNLLLLLNNKINAFGGRNLEKLRSEDIKIGSYCLAPFEDEFYRAEVKHVDSSKVEVFFVDFGNSEVVERSQLRKCAPVLLKYPHQAFECFLSEIRPIHGAWSQEAKEFFSQVAPIGTKRFVGKIYSQVYNAYRLDLFSDDISINRLLIERGYAMYMEESLLSKSRHEEISKSPCRTSNRETSQKYIEDSSEIERGEEALKIVLRGPYSPYELSFSNLTSIGRTRSARIEQDSVNSVLICDELEGRYTRCLVAAYITTNNTGNTAIARETCLLPNIHGISSILALLFAPEAELRCDKKQTYLTGALCGLGCDRKGAAILHDNDIEITFDVKIGDNDLLLINTIRMLINESIGIDSEKIDYAPKKIAEIQAYARSALMELVNTRREDIEPCFYHREYKWRQIDKSLLKESGNEEKPTHLYGYHKGISLNEVTIIDPRILEKRRLLNEFHNLAGNSLVAFDNEVTCPVCQVTCRHPLGLSLHCETSGHINWCLGIFKDS